MPISNNDKEFIANRQKELKDRSRTDHEKWNKKIKELRDIQKNTKQIKNK